MNVVRNYALPIVGGNLTVPIGGLMDVVLPGEDPSTLTLGIEISSEEQETETRSFKVFVGEEDITGLAYCGSARISPSVVAHVFEA